MNLEVHRKQQHTAVIDTLKYSTASSHHISLTDECWYTIMYMKHKHVSYLQSLCYVTLRQTFSFLCTSTHNYNNKLHTVICCAVCTLWICSTRKPSYRWQTRSTRKPAKNCSNSTCLQRYRWQYWPIFIRLAVIASKICKIPRNSLKIQTYGVQGHPRSSILVSIESPCTSSY